MVRRSKRRRWIVVATLVGLFAFLFYQWNAAIKRNRSIPDAPFQIAENLYSVGSTGVTSFLLTGPEGDVLIDGGYPETAPLIIGSIAKLGFNIKDVRVLLNSHAHFDHAGGLRELQQASGAQLWISEGDAPIVASGGADDHGSYGPLRFLHVGRFPAPRVDHRFTSDTTIRVGPLAVTAHITAGHTPGCTTWSTVIHHNGRDLLAVDVCSVTQLPFMKLSDPQVYPGIRSDFEKSFQTLRQLPADIFLGSHGSFFNLAKKRAARAKATDAVEPFIDRDGYRRFIDDAEADFRKRLVHNRDGREAALAPPPDGAPLPTIVAGAVPVRFVVAVVFAVRAVAAIIIAMLPNPPFARPFLFLRALSIRMVVRALRSRPIINRGTTATVVDPAVGSVGACAIVDPAVADRTVGAVRAIDSAARPARRLLVESTVQDARAQIVRA